MTTLKEWLVFRPWERHSLVLMVGGLVYVAVGASFLSSAPLGERRALTLKVALNIMPIQHWSWLFIACGLLAMASSRWPTFSDSWGYIVLTGLSSGWSAMYFGGYFLGEAPSANTSYGLIWGLMAFMWWAISGLVNPDRRLVIRNGPD